MSWRHLERAKQLALALVIGATVICGEGHAAGDCGPFLFARSTFAELTNDLEPSVLQIRSGDNFGTAFLVDIKRGLFLTARHVIEGASNNGTVGVFGENRIITKQSLHVISEEPDLDVALLQADDPDKFSGDLIFELYFKGVPRGTEAWYFGYPYGKDDQMLRSVRASISGYNPQKPELLIAGPITEGYSGSPVITDQGLVVGIIVEKRERSEAVAVPMTRLAKFVAMYVDQHPYSKPDDPAVSFREQFMTQNQDSLAFLLQPSHRHDSISNWHLYGAVEKLVEGNYLDRGSVVSKVECPLIPAVDDRGLPMRVLEQLSAKAWNQRDHAKSRYSELDEINTSNVGKLQLAWTFSTGVLRGHEGAPLVIGDVMYVHAPFPNTVFALDLSHDGRILWKYEPIQDPNVINLMCCDTVNRGLAYGDDKLFLHQADTSLVALDAQTGKVAWSVKTGDPGKGETGIGSPMVVKDKVYVGISGSQFGVRGWVAAYSATDGKQVWRAWSVGPDSDVLVDPQKTTELGKPIGADSSLRSWQGDQWKIGGGTTSGWYSYDPRLNLIYYGTGNPSPWNPKQRPGDNKWSMTIFARDADTGMAKWVYQMTPHDQWGYDGVNEMILADQEINGETVSTLVHFDGNGLAYTLNRATGELLVVAKYDSTVNWTTGVEMNKNSPNYGRPNVAAKYAPGEGGEGMNTEGICPHSLGAKNEQPAAYSPETGLFYVPTGQFCMDYKSFPVSYAAGQPYVGATVSMYPPPGQTNTGRFIAWDAAKGKLAWVDSERFAVWSGALATRGGLVFYGTLEGYLKAADAKTGKVLYTFKTPSGIIGNVITYQHGGKQYVAVLSGVGGSPGIGLAAGLTDPNAGLGAVGGYAALSNYTALGGTLAVFSLP